MICALSMSRVVAIAGIALGSVGAGAAQVGSTSRDRVSISITILPRVQASVSPAGSGTYPKEICLSASSFGSYHAIVVSAHDLDAPGWIAAEAIVPEEITCGRDWTRATPPESKAARHRTLANPSKPAILLIIPD